MRLLWTLFQSSRGKALLGGACGTVAGLSSAAVAAIVVEVVTSGGADLARQAIRFALCWLGYALGSVGSAFFIGQVSQEALQWLRLDFSRRILATPLATLERTGGRLFTVLVDDIALISHAVERLPSVLAGAATVAGCLLYLLYKSPVLTGIFLGLLALGAACYLWPLARIQRLLSPLRQESNRTYVLLQSLHLGLKDLLQSRRRRDAFLHRHLQPVARRHGVLTVRIRVIETIFSRWGELYLLLCLGGLLFSIPLHGLATWTAFGEFMFVVLFMLGALTTVTGFIATASRVNVSLRQIEAAGIDLGEAGLAPVAGEDAAPAQLRPLAFRDVRFHFPPRDGTPGFELGPVSIAFTRPEIVFVAGGNGSGKTTFLKLLTGLYSPRAGEISWDGAPVDEAERDAYRQQFSVVFSDTHVFDALLGREEDPLTEEASRLLQAMRLESKVSFGAGRFSTTDLSQGQRKRLALIVALLEDRPVFVFDEWAADQDPEFRRVFYDQFLPELKRRGRLVVAITHDEHYYDRADRMIRISEGRIVSDTLLREAPVPA